MERCGSMVLMPVISRLYGNLSETLATGMVTSVSPKAEAFEEALKHYRLRHLALKEVEKSSGGKLHD